MSARKIERKCRKKISPKNAKTPATARTAAPLPSRVALRVTSAFASSISSRTRICAFSATSATVWPSCCERFRSGSLTAKALEDQGGEEAAGERCADEDLRSLGGRYAAIRAHGAVRVAAG